ncbi:DENN (AEX-3) domain-containing protein [Striga hermonthica]|uniref:DENN (AEX-3) domain-containing protein n=1 Tax=Striga hermonthica TaxID=68872 RepID=A0A9N7NKB5_STRHE|nr:DENN (AEX-3) domain-containing protein [Striga hermonthica]
MRSKENIDIQDNWWSAPDSPIEMLHKFSQKAVKRASDSLHSSYSGSPNRNTPNPEHPEGHRRTHSDLTSSLPRSTSSINFQKWKSQVQRALYWRSRSFCEDRQYFSFDPEMLANQKRQWYKIQSRALDPDKFKEPASLFEHFIIVGLRPDTNLEVVLFKYPPRKKVALRLKDLASFCFPGGVKAGVLTRTPSLSELNEQLYGQEPPAMSEVSSPCSESDPDSNRFLGSAPRCYCILTKVPFFELHFEMLNSIIAQKHLNRISQFANDCCADWMSVTIPADDEVAQSTWDICSPVSSSTLAFDDCTSEKMSIGLDHICPVNDQFSETSFSSAVSTASDDEADEIFYDYAKSIAYDIRMENKNDLLQILSNYHSLPLPPRGSEIVFQPLEHLEPIEYFRPPLSSLDLCGKNLDYKLGDYKEVSQVNIKLAAAEESLALSLWPTATICRVLSLESILALVTSVLLEKQVVVLCPNLGVLSAIVLSLIPIIRPFEWQSLFLPILPVKMLDFIDAPVPFIHESEESQSAPCCLPKIQVDHFLICSRPVDLGRAKRAPVQN